MSDERKREEFEREEREGKREREKKLGVFFT